MHSSEQAAPVENRLFTPGVLVLIALMSIGFLFGAARFLFGLGAVTNLNDQFPWGLWIGIDLVTGVALAAGGFTTSALAYVFNRAQFHAVVRPALLTAMLGYTFVTLGLMVDIGRYWNIWRPLISWNPNSVLFEVAMCVAIYSNVLFIEFIPIVVERFKGKVNLPGTLQVFDGLIETLLGLADRILGKVMFLFIIAGVVLSFLHQSGLGSLMLIAPYKVHPLWYTPILPLLFLLSAITVGYPMVVFESLITSKSLRREPEMAVLTPLAKFMPVLIGIYLVVKLGDMMVRGTYTYLFDGTLQSNAFMVEVLFGLILPFLLLLSGRVRKSAGWLFFASTLYVLGVVLNRVNVFIVSFTPPYMMERYFPAVGEFAVTIGFIAALIFLYRVFVTLFPVLGTHGKSKASALVLLMSLALIFSAQTPAKGAMGDVSEKKKVTLAILPITPSIEDAPKVRILNSPVMNDYKDLYAPVRFMHGKHANVVRDCTVCHHRIPKYEGDTYGQPATMATLIGAKTLPASCDSCHDRPWNPGRVHVPGLKGAYHQQCMSCHKDSRQKPEVKATRYRLLVADLEGTRSLVSLAPLDCISCHAKNVPDHKELVKMEGTVDALAVTQNCLTCHEDQGKAMLKTSHWRWQGPSPFTSGNEKRVDLGKRSQIMNNTTIVLKGNWGRCTGCHAGYGWNDDKFDFTDMGRIDCLVCHDTTGTYKKSSTGGGSPEASVDLLRVAQHVGRPGRATCGLNCHFSGDTTDPLKHAAMNSKLLAPDRNLDVHMAKDGVDLRCVDCHTSRDHKISGRSLSDPTVEGYFSCESCHTDKPHIGSRLLTHHLNTHTENVSCQTCHIPVYAKASPAMTRWDWSTAGKDMKGSERQSKMRTYRKELGSLTWKETGKPVYRWYNGMVKRYLLGDPSNDSGATELNKPEGRLEDAGSKIYPFKIITGKQISDANYKFLITPKLWQGYWQSGDWDKAARDGLSIAGLEYSGKYEFVETVSYAGLHHEVLPKKRALSCAQCHTSLAKEPSCARCHQDRPDIDFKALAHEGIDFKELVKEGHDAQALVGRTDYIDFKALGYAGDPIEVGGRFKGLPLVLRAQSRGEEGSSPSEEAGNDQPPSATQ